MKMFHGFFGGKVMWFIALFLGFHTLAFAAPTTPTSDFTDNGDGTVTHKTTGLTWKRCSEGQAWTGSTCSGTAATYTQGEADALASGGWRLPRADELYTIIERDNYPPLVNSSLFPATPSARFVTSTGIEWIRSFVSRRSFDFGDGRDYVMDDQYFVQKYNVRLVRGGQPLDSSGLYTPSSSFSDNGDGTVTHKKTGLTWKRCAEGQTGKSVTTTKPGGFGAPNITTTTYVCDGAAKTYTWSETNALSTGGWHLPTVNDLLSIVEWGAHFPKINGEIFPNLPVTQRPGVFNLPITDSYFWSATLNKAGATSNGWFVDFYQYESNITGTYFVRLVRGGQPDAPSSPASFNALSVNCPVTLAANASGTCSATATYSDNSSKAINPTWSVSGNAASISSSGQLTANAVASDATVTITASYTESGVTKSATQIVTIKATSGSAVNPSDCLFDWAEKNYPQLFSSASGASQTSAPYYYRYYAQTDAYLATSTDNHVYYAKNANLVDVGLTSQWFATAGCK